MQNKSLFLCFILILLIIFLLCFTKVKIYGDGYEYLEMAISIKNHSSFDMQTSDREEISNLFSNKSLNDFDFLENSYFKALNNKLYCYHFWFYSLLSTPILLLLKFLKINILYAFKITNLILITFLFGWILFRNASMKDKDKIFLFFITLFSPIWLYYNWTHPEVFTFVMLYIGLIEYYNKKLLSVIFLISLASLQNPACSFLVLAILIKEIFYFLNMQTKDNIVKKNIIIATIISLINLLPYIFYYINFHEFSLIAKTYIDLNTISFNKIMSLFFDLNYGLIIYFPILFILLIFLCVKRNKKALFSLGIILIFATINSSQTNWNPGIQLLHRYSYWMIPIVIYGCLDFIINLSKEKKIIILVWSILTFCPWLIYNAIFSHDSDNYLIMQPVAKIVLNNIPELYNPPEEIFCERVIKKDGCNTDSLPVFYTNPNTTEKTKGLFYDKNKQKTYYINYPTKITKHFYRRKYE